MCRTVVFSHSILLIAEYGPFWWLIFELFDDDTRIAYSDAVGRDVFNDYASCSDCAAFTNVTPGRIVTLPPIQQLLPIVTGLAHSCLVLRSSGSVLWQAV